MRARALIVPCAVAAVITALVPLGSRSGRDAPRSLSAERVAPLAARAPGEGPAALSDARRSASAGARDEPRGADVSDAAATTEQPAGAPRTDARLAGIVRYRDDHAPAAHVELVLAKGGVMAFARTDAEGRFRVTEDLGVGVVDVRHEPSAAAPLQLRYVPETVTLAAASRFSGPLELWLARPEAVLDVDAVGLDGAPVPRAAVELEQVSVGPTGAVRHSLEHATTDDRGRARFALYDLGETRAAGVVARLWSQTDERAGGHRGARLVSALARLAAPLHAPALEPPLRLVLDAPATVSVRVATRDGAPLAERGVLVDDLDPDLGWWLAGVPLTDERGEARFTGLPAGRYRFSLLRAPHVEPRELALVAGERGELDLVVETPALALAASGRVVDEEGQPLAQRTVTARLVGGSGSPRVVETTTDAEGRFELAAPTAERVVVSASVGLFADEYEPRELEAPFGARDVELRRTRALPLETVAFEVVDASTGHLVRDVLVMVYRAPALDEYTFDRAVEGRARPRCPVHPDTTFVLDAPGYRRRTVLAVDLAAMAPDGEVPRVALERGVLRELRVVDAHERPVAGAVVSRGPAALGATDAAGLVVVDLTLWPEEGLVVTAEARAPAAWNPRDGFADLAPAVVVLTDHTSASR